MSDAPRKIDARSGLDWNRDSVWVADATPLKKIDTASGPSYSKPSGETVILTDDELSRRYYAFNDGEFFKPQLRPEQAIYISDEINLVVGAKDNMIVKDCALIRSQDGRIRTIPRTEYQREYRVVGYRGAKKPLTPFSTPPTNQ